VKKQSSKGPQLAVMCVPLVYISADLSNALSDILFSSAALLHCISFMQHEGKRCNRHINLTWEAPSEGYFWNDYLSWFCSGQITSPKGRFFLPIGQQLSVKSCWNWSASQ